MKKRLFLALIMITLLAGAVSARGFSMSAGVGGKFSADFSHYLWGFSEDTDNYLENWGWEKDSFNQRKVGGGFFGFFDATYFLAELGGQFYNIEPLNKDAQKSLKNSKTKLSRSVFDIGLFLKIPIWIGQYGSIFPMFGGDIQIAVENATTVDGKREAYKKYGNGDKVSEYNTQVFFKFGIGGDIPIGKMIYIRPMILYGLGTNTKAQKEDRDFHNEDDMNLWLIIDHGLDIKLAVGFRFFSSAK